MDAGALSYDPWGKPGAGAPVTDGQGKVVTRRSLPISLLHTDAVELKKSQEKLSRPSRTGQAHLEELRQEMVEHKQARDKGKQLDMQTYTDLATKLREGVVGTVRKDPVTGEHAASRRISDVTSEKLDIRRTDKRRSAEYYRELAEQTQERGEREQRERAADIQQQQAHAKSFDSFWGKPGAGAPVAQSGGGHQKHGLDGLLSCDHSPVKSPLKPSPKRMSRSKHSNNYEGDSADVIPQYTPMPPWRTA